MRLEGRVIRGAGQAAFFTRLDWVREAFRRQFGFDPYPGTLNVEVFKEHAAAVNTLSRAAGISLVPPTPQFCTAKALPVTVGGIRGALILPEETVRVHGASIVEIVAPLRLKGALGLADGDTVAVSVQMLKTHP